MGYFSAVLAEPAAQAAGRLSVQDLLSRNMLGSEVYGPLFAQLGIPAWQTAPGGSLESGMPMLEDRPNEAALRALEGYTFDWQNTGYGNTGTLIAYDPAGKEVGKYAQKDQSTVQSLGEAAALAAAGFGGLGALGFGPLSGLFGGAGGAGAAAGGTSAGAVDAAALGLDAGFTAGAGGGTVGGTVGGGLTLGGSAGYGTIAANPAALGAGGAGLSSGVGLTAPTFTGTGLGMTAGAGTAAAGSGGITSLLSSLGSVGGIKDLASIASGVYGMKLAGDARQASDPFAPYRGAYGAQLAALEANPGSIVSRPGFQAGLETIQRKSAASGYYGSGNMASALSRYSGDFYNQEAARLAGLAGAGQTPGAGQALGADLASQSLGSIGYGLAPMLERFIRGG